MKLTTEQVEQLLETHTEVVCLHKNDNFQSFSWDGDLDGYSYNFSSQEQELHCDSTPEEIREVLTTHLLTMDYKGQVDNYTTTIIKL